jgi:mono/diheme cytochrome c family protein
VTTRTTARRMFATPRGRSGAAGMLGVTSLLACSAAGQAQQATPADGRRIAEHCCARCHVVAPGGGAGWTDAPAFVESAQDPKVTRAWMRDFVTKLHMHMLNTDRSPAEADAITAYLLSLRHRW